MYWLFVQVQRAYRDGRRWRVAEAAAMKKGSRKLGSSFALHSNHVVTYIQSTLTKYDTKTAGAYTEQSKTAQRVR